MNSYALFFYVSCCFSFILGSLGWTYPIRTWRERFLLADVVVVIFSLAAYWLAPIFFGSKAPLKHVNIFLSCSFWMIILAARLLNKAGAGPAFVKIKRKLNWIQILCVILLFELARTEITLIRDSLLEHAKPELQTLQSLVFFTIPMGIWSLVSVIPTVEFCARGIRDGSSIKYYSDIIAYTWRSTEKHQEIQLVLWEKFFRRNGESTIEVPVQDMPAIENLLAQHVPGQASVQPEAR